MKDKKKLYIVVAVILLVLVGSASYMKFKGNSVNENVEPRGVVTSIKDALSKDVTLVCEFKDDSGVSIKSYIKNGAVRVSSTGGGTGTTQSGEIIMKDKKMYMWDLKTKQGFVYDIPDEESSTSITSTEINQSDNYLSMIDKYKDSCKVSSVEDSYFVIPTDIKFQDMGKLLEDLKKQPSSTPNYY